MAYLIANENTRLRIEQAAKSIASTARRIGTRAQQAVTTEELSRFLTNIRVACANVEALAQIPPSEASLKLDAALQAIRDYLDWGAMTGSDRDLFASRFREVLGRPDPPVEPPSFAVQPDKEA